MALEMAYNIKKETHHLMTVSSKQTKTTIRPRSSNHATVIRIHGNFSMHELQRALGGIRARHAVLIPEPETSHFPVQEITSAAKLTWQEVVKEELLNPFPAQGPFARFILLR